MKKTMFMGLVIGAIAIAMVAAGSSSVIPVTAQQNNKDNAQGGLNNADDNVHDNAGGPNAELGSDQDVRFHEGLCQGGHSTSALDCEDAKEQGIIGEPGNSDENRQDDNDDDEDDDGDDDDEE
jgi:hypothetical protein